MGRPAAPPRAKPGPPAALPSRPGPRGPARGARLPGASRTPRGLQRRPSRASPRAGALPSLHGVYPEEAAGAAAAALLQGEVSAGPGLRAEAGRAGAGVGGRGRGARSGAGAGFPAGPREVGPGVGTRHKGRGPEHAGRSGGGRGRSPGAGSGPGSRPGRVASRAQVGPRGSPGRGREGPGAPARDASPGVLWRGAAGGARAGGLPLSPPPRVTGAGSGHCVGAVGAFRRGCPPRSATTPPAPGRTWIPRFIAPFFVDFFRRKAKARACPAPCPAGPRGGPQERPYSAKSQGPPHKRVVPSDGSHYIQDKCIGRLCIQTRGEAQQSLSPDPSRDLGSRELNQMISEQQHPFSF